MSRTNYVQKQLVFWGSVTGTAAGGAVAITYALQNGPGVLTGIHAAAGIYPITLPANFTIPMNRRMVIVTPATAVADAAMQYDPAAALANVVTVQTRAAGVLVDTVDFFFEIFRIEMLP